MSRELAYCPNLNCEGATGFEVTWRHATLTEPAEPIRDTCPHCGEQWSNRPNPWLFAAEEIHGVLQSYDLIARDCSLDYDALAQAITKELARQADHKRQQNRGKAA